jgi:hypothetical protein
LSPVDSLAKVEWNGTRWVLGTAPRSIANLNCFAPP